MLNYHLQILGLRQTNYPFSIEWLKVENDKVKPNDTILEMRNSNGDLIKSIKSQCHGKISECYLPKKCLVINLVNSEIINECIVDQLEIFDEISNIKRNISININIGKYLFGKYICDHCTFLSNICVECGLTLEEYTENSDKPVVNAGFLSNVTDFTFSKSYITEVEKNYIHELLLKRKNLNLVLDLDNTLIHATSTLPNIGSDQLITIPLKDILKNNVNYETISKYSGSIVTFSNSIDKGFLPENWTCLPHYIDEEDNIFGLEAEKYRQLIEKLIFCIPYPNSSNNGIDNWSQGFYKLRPGVLNMLRRLKDKFELYMYTMGTELHAYSALRIIDPEFRFFHPKRLFYRNNGFKDCNSKSLSTLFPYDHRTLIVIDDIEQAWSNSNSLIKVYPYNFFPSAPLPVDASCYSRYIAINRINYKWESIINSYKKRQRKDSIDVKDNINDILNMCNTNNQSNDSLLFSALNKMINNEKDSQLFILENILNAIYLAYFKELDLCLERSKSQLIDNNIDLIYQIAPDISNIISIMRQNVLNSLILQVSGFKNKITPNFQSIDLFIWALKFGAKLCTDNDVPTHCICDKFYTKKYYDAKKKGIPCIYIIWLEIAIYTWTNPEIFNDLNDKYGETQDQLIDLTPFDVLPFSNCLNWRDFVQKYSKYFDLYKLNKNKSLHDILWDEVFDNISLLNEDDRSDISETSYIYNNKPFDEDLLS
ncbi:NLI interacting factor-like phosphatase family protein [Cryptosporidium muris RN66]|uniref:protein-serine/threonine phosphatase n=1 Tax=Cryptosporidium muris (strain RN66) TaxID=441375 RepID=B6AIY6_CRYMR|nr:NLI interacting factor-like phosphatase family protein [Cryptosporidium muris RN66]EEA08177.1 NLI interacting factor-like phosphatase family protein [Cryptosporidium muris RN66]|eukprot:XP_002142526.1 NLI interacting factor-like phosphatase family protein [Cryptosporidium muris RN66]